MCFSDQMCSYLYTQLGGSSKSLVIHFLTFPIFTPLLHMYFLALYIHPLLVSCSCFVLPHSDTLCSYALYSLFFLYLVMPHAHIASVCYDILSLCQDFCIKYILLQVDLRCHHNTKPSSHKRVRTPHKKHTACPAKMIIKIRQEKLSKR